MICRSYLRPGSRRAKNAWAAKSRLILQGGGSAAHPETSSPSHGRFSLGLLDCLAIPLVGRKIYDYYKSCATDTDAQSTWLNAFYPTGFIQYFDDKAPTESQYCEFVREGLQRSIEGRPKRWISTRVRSIVLDKHGAALLKEFPSLAAMRSYAPNLRRLTMSSNEGTTGTPDARSRRRTKERSEIRWRDAHPSVELRWDEEIPSCFTDVTASEAGREVILAAAQWGMRFPKTFRTSKDGIRVGAVPAQRDVGTLGPIHSLVVGGPDSKPGDDVLADLRLSLTNMSAQIMSLPKRVEIDMNTSDPQDWHQAIHELRRAYSARFPLNSLTLGCSGGGRAPSFGDTVSSGLWSALNFCTNVQVSVRRRKEPEACVTHGVEVPKSIRSIIVDVGDDELDVNAATTLASSIRFRTGKAETSVRFTGANDHSMPFRLANSVMANRL